MAEGLRSKGNNDYFTELFVKFEKTVREQLSAIQEQLDHVKTEIHSSNSRLTNLESAREGSASAVPSSPPKLHDSPTNSRSNSFPKFKLDVPVSMELTRKVGLLRLTIFSSFIKPRMNNGLL